MRCSRGFIGFFYVVIHLGPMLAVLRRQNFRDLPGSMLDSKICHKLGIPEMIGNNLKPY